MANTMRFKKLRRVYRTIGEVAKMTKNEKWYCLRHPKTHQELVQTSWWRMLSWKARGYQLLSVVEWKVNKNVKA